MRVLILSALLMGCSAGEKKTESTRAGEPPTTLSTSKQDVAADLEMICDTATSVQQNKAAKVQEKQLEFVKIASTQIKSDQVRQLFNKAGATKTSARYAVWLQGAKTLGFTTWSCPPLKGL